MANEQIGNEIPVPSFTEQPYLDNEEIMASMKGGFTEIGVTLAGSQGILPAGTVLGRQTANKKFYVYDDGASDGTEVARGILRRRVDTTDGDIHANMVTAGIVTDSKISGLDANGITDLNGRQDTVLDIFRF